MQLDELRLVSFNARGLRDLKKRKQLFRILKEKRADIIMIQEAHCNDETLQLWTHQWGGKIFSSQGATNARGVMTLFKKGLPVKILDSQKILMAAFFS